MISKELLSELYEPGTLLNKVRDNSFIIDNEKWDSYVMVNIHELAHMCILYAWDKMYEITPRVMGTEILCLKTGYHLHIIQKEDIENPKPFDPRFTFKACQWILDNR